MNVAHPMTLGAAMVFIIAGVIVYRRGARQDSNHGSQGAVIMLVIGVILAIHGLGLFEYRPSQSEIEQAAERGASQ
jgi:hypothetical protein